MKQNIIAFVIGILSSVAATWLGPFARPPANNEPGLTDVLLAPVPVVAFFFLAALIVVVALVVNARTASHSASAIEQSRLALMAEQEKTEELTRKVKDIQTQRAREAKATRETRFVLARRVAAAIESPKDGVQPTRDEISQILVALVGGNHSEVEVNDAIAWMLAEEILEVQDRKLRLRVGWQQRLSYLEAHAG